jgi:putative transcriptional regulator
MNLAGKFLIAMPGMGDPRFEHSVVVVCAHSSEGAMGLIVNKPAPAPGVAEVLAELDLPPAQSGRVPQLTVQFGGPVEPGRGFVLHSLDWQRKATSPLVPGLALTTSRDILQDIAAGRGPSRALLLMGYAGWGAGQLEDEILANGWLTGEADAELVLGGANNRKWEAALAGLGVNPLSLSATAGRA